MLEQSVDLDRTFQALADSGRRAMVERLTLGPASVSELARPMTMTLAAVLQHVQILEACGVVRTQKVGRTRICRIEPAAMAEAEQWIRQRRQAWEVRLDRLDDLLREESDTTEKAPMPTRSATHDTFVIRRTFAAPVSQVFRAWSDPQRKARWFGGSPDAPAPDHVLDFREGGSESWAGGPPDGLTYHYHAQYRDIRLDERIVYAYEMHAGEDRISVSLATIEFRGSGGTTEVVVTEQGVFLDGLDTPAQREAGTHDLLDALAALLSVEV